MFVSVCGRVLVHFTPGPTHVDLREKRHCLTRAALIGHRAVGTQTAPLNSLVVLWMLAVQLADRRPSRGCVHVLLKTSTGTRAWPQLWLSQLCHPLRPRSPWETRIRVRAGRKKPAARARVRSGFGARGCKRIRRLPSERQAAHMEMVDPEVVQNGRRCVCTWRPWRQIGQGRRSRSSR